jgi:glutamine synthetase adenylyltransferase
MTDTQLWDKQLRAAITSKLRQLRRDQVVGMSVANLRQVTPTRTFTMPVGYFANRFDDVAREAGRVVGVDVY